MLWKYFQRFSFIAKWDSTGSLRRPTIQYVRSIILHQCREWKPGIVIINSLFEENNIYVCWLTPVWLQPMNVFVTIWKLVYADLWWWWNYNPSTLAVMKELGPEWLIDKMKYTCISENPQILVNWFSRVGITWALDGMWVGMSAKPCISR